MLKNQRITAATLKPLYTIINRTIKCIDTTSYTQVRNTVISATEEIVRLRDSFNSQKPPPIFGGTMGQYDPLNLPDPPYLPE